MPNPGPGGITSPYMFDGFPTIISFSLNGAVHLYEKSVEPFGYSGGGPINVDTMRNIALRTQSPKSLITILAGMVKSAYKPLLITQIAAMLLRNQQLQILWPTGDLVLFYGWIEEFKPETLEEGKMPLADVKLEPSNLTNSAVEVAPAWSIV